MPKSISIGMVGLGQFGKEFVPLFRDHPQVHRIALCDIDPQKLRSTAQRFQINETYPSLEALCKTDIDAIVLITQPWLHAPQAIQAMEAGKDVYSAVPIILPDSGKSQEIYDWCGKIIETCKTTGRKYMLGETSYYRAEVQYAIKQHQQHAFGRIVMVEAEYLHDTLLPGCNLIKVQQGRTGLSEQEVYKLGGGVPIHYVTHSASVPIAITGAHATQISCFGYSIPDDPYYRKDSVSGNILSNEVATFRMSDGSIGRIIEGRRIGHIGREALYRVLGTECSMEVNLKSSIWISKTKSHEIKGDWRDKLPKSLAKYAKGGHGGSHPRLVHEFVSALTENRQPKINAWEAARYMAVGAAAHDSALQGGKLLDVPDWGDAPK